MRCKSFYESIDIAPQPLEDMKRRFQFNQWVYINLIKPRMSVCPVVPLTGEDFKVICPFYKAKEQAKHDEWAGVDDHNRLKRELTGACGEYGSLKFWGWEDRFDAEIVGDSRKKSFPDFRPFGIQCEIKGSALGNVPIVFRENKCSNLIYTTDHKKVWLLGIATPEVLKTYVDDNLRLTFARPDKIGFYGFAHLVDAPSSREDLKSLCEKFRLDLGFRNGIMLP